MRFSRREITNVREEIIKLLKTQVKTRDVTKLLDYLEGSSYFIDPASSYYHCNEPGGLASHSLNLTYILLDLVTYFGYKDRYSPESIVLIGLLHDLCKVGTYTIEQKWQKNKYGKWESYDTYGNVRPIIEYPHALQSLMIIKDLIELTSVEEQAIYWHMGVFDITESDMRLYNKAIHNEPIIYLTHVADMCSSTIFEPTHPKDKIPFK